MPSFRTGIVTEIVATRAALQRVLVDLGSGPEPAFVLTEIIGTVATGDRVVVNTTAVELGLGTGGSHIVHWNLARDSWRSDSVGHVMKMRYASGQVDVDAPGSELMSISGTPVVVAGLHSQVAAVAVAFKDARPDARLAYVMTDGGALPIALSDLVCELRAGGLIDVTVTAGHAFGGDVEAVSIYDALAIASEQADAIVVAMGPGGAGTGTALGFSAIEVGNALDAAATLGGNPIAVLRASARDPRARHQGLSHHSETALTLATRAAVTVPTPPGVQWTHPGHSAVPVENVGIAARFAERGLSVESMGRPAAEDPLLFECGAAAGVLAARAVP